jgi:hypothetical protein|tara:strand:- start:777 stop:1364 length:588 start_codon:yes stop_codon:yes gene_type:complete
LFFFLNKVDANKIKKKEEVREREEEKEKYGNFIWGLSQELSLVIRQSDLIENHIETVINVGKKKGKIVNKKNTLFFSTEYLKLLQEKIIENDFHHPLLLSKLSVLINIMELINASLDFEELGHLSQVYNNKRDFEQGLDTYLKTLKEDYLDNIKANNSVIQELISEELKVLNPDLKRLKEEAQTKKYLEILRSER